MVVGRGSQSSLHPSVSAVLSSGSLPMERTRNVFLYPHERLTRLLLLSTLCRGTFHHREHSCGIISSTQNIPFNRIFLWSIDHNSAGYLTESIASYTEILLH